MAGWNGSGVFVRLYNWVQDQANGIKILASRMDGEFNNYKTGLENCVTRDGQNVPLDNLPMGGFKHTGVANAAATDEYMALGQFTTQLNTHSQDFTNSVGINGAGLADHRYFAINVDSGKDAAMFAKINTKLRWLWGCVSGSAWNLQRYDATEAFLDSPISVNLTTGKVSINGVSTADVSLGASGYAKFPNGLIVQWGTSTTAGGAGLAVVIFPIAFPTYCAAAIPTTNTGGGLHNPSANNISASGFDAYCFNALTGAASADGITVSYIAIGY